MEIEITQEILEICNAILQSYKDELSYDGINASNKLSDTATYNCQWRGKYFEIYFNLQEYWKYIENGTRAHFPPIAPIEEWIKVKKLVPRQYNGNIPTTKQLAYMVSKKISKEGTEGKYPLKLSMNKANDNGLFDLLANALIDSMNKEIDKEIDNL